MIYEGSKTAGMHVSQPLRIGIVLCGRYSLNLLLL